MNVPCRSYMTRHQMSTLEDKLNNILGNKVVSFVQVNDCEGHGVIGITLVMADDTRVELYARERNGGGLIVVDTGDDLVSQ